MIESVKIENLRGIREGEVTGLSPLSILVGPNNCGKSTVLEAVAFFAYGHEVHRLVELLVGQRGRPGPGNIPTTMPVRTMIRIGHDSARVSARLPNEDVELTLRVGAPWDRAHEPAYASLSPDRVRVDLMPNKNIATTCYIDGRLQLSASVAPLRKLMPAAFLRADAVRIGLEDLYSHFAKAQLADEVTKALSVAFPGLTKLEILTEDGLPVLHTQSPQGAVPAFLAGDGFKRLVAVAGALAKASGGLTLLEEPEGFQHPRYLREIATMLTSAAWRGTQVVLSTHSLELVDQLLAARPEGAVFPTVHRLRLIDGQLRSTKFMPEDAESLRVELETDLRS